MLFGIPKTTSAQEVLDDECFIVTANTDCDVEGVSWIIYSPDPSQTDDGSATQINDSELEVEGFTAFADSLLTNLTTGQEDEAQAFDDGTGLAYADIGVPLTNRNVYDVSGDHEIVDNNQDCELDPNCGQAFDVGVSEVDLSTFTPAITSISPTFGYVGTTIGSIIIRGTDLADPFDGSINFSTTPVVSGLTITGASFEVLGITPEGFSEVLQLDYQLDQCATTGGITFVFTTTIGRGSGDQTFTIGDPSPLIDSVSPSVWPAGTNVPITVQGSAFGTNPILTVLGTGVSVLSGTVLVSDTQISATVSVASNAPNQTATVEVQSQGYCGSGFVPANGNSSVATSGAQVVASPGPAPTIFLYGSTNITNQTTNVIVGQQIALSATVSLPQNVTISSQQWSMPDGTVVGGYNASQSAGCVLLIAGQSSQPGACTGSPVSRTNSSFAFYWVDSGNSRQITYTYTASNGSTNSAMTTFNINAPSVAGASAQTGQATVVPVDFSSLPPTINPNGVPTLWLLGVQGPGGTIGSNVGTVFQASGTPPSGNTGAYSWVQLINKDLLYQDDSKASGACSGGVPKGSSLLDTTYPYQVTTTSVGAVIPNDIASDSPRYPMVQNWGEVARSFEATMYLMWIPDADGRCTGSACTIPVPLGAISATTTGWTFMGDTINTLSSLQGINQTTWIMNFQGQPPVPKFQPSHPSTDQNNGFPTWTSLASYGANFFGCQ